MATEAGISAEEFERLQIQLLDLRTENYQLAEYRNKLETDLKAANARELKLQDDLSTANATISKSKKAKEVFHLEQEVAITKLKLNVQEEEFRLQQSTLLAELNKVSKQNEDLKVEKSRLQQNLRHDTQVHNNSLDEETVTALQSKVRGAKLDLQNNFEACKSTYDKLKQQNEENLTKLAYLEQQVTELNEKFRRKQESYQMLSDEKERQYNEYKKSLDYIVAKKDAEITEMADQLSTLRKNLNKASETRDLHTSAVDSLKSECNRFKKLYEQSIEQNEAFQIQLQESLSANDCLSSQLEQAKQDVVNMQSQVDEAFVAASKRKELLDDLNVHLEEMKDKHRVEKESQGNEYGRQIATLKNLLDDSNIKLSSYENVASKLSCLETSIEDKNEQIRKLEGELADARLQLEMAQIQHDEFLHKQRTDFDTCSRNMAEKYEKDSKDLRLAAEKLLEEKERLYASIEASKQDVKDKVEQICLVERKHGHIVKDLKRQIQTEKKRGDKLQDRLQEILNEISRNRSPGLDDVKILERHRDGKIAGDSSSVSSWTVVSGQHNKEIDRRSNAGDQNSESSLTMIESEDHELIGRIAQLQRQNYELTEKVQMLEESSAAMAEDLVRKTAIIEQYVKEKPLLVNAHSGHASSPPELRLPSGLKKVIDFVKIDQSSDDVREMNKRLQLMLEESLMKNMHLQRDLEIMSKQAENLSTCDK